MIAVWMIWATLITFVLGIAALLAERVLRSAGHPARWAWVGGFAVALGLQVWSRARPSSGATSQPSDRLLGTIDLAWLADVQAAAARVTPGWMEPVERILIVSWAAAAALLTVALVGGLLVLARRAGRWHTARVEGQDVLVSPDFGPALVGVWGPRIVLPSWMLRLPPSDVRLACLHEAEHRAARDTWTLFAGAFAVAVMPWNAALWWQLLRLRAAVEMDCDARVLRAGASRRAYGTLLLSIGSARSRVRLPVLAMTRPASLLERRLTMIMKDVRPGTGARMTLVTALSTLLVIVACETPAPMASAPEEAAPEEAATANRSDAHMWAERATGRSSRELRLRPDDVMIFVDGEEWSGPLKSLDPDAVARVEILKGPAAVASYGPEASGGVIQIYTKGES